MPELPEVEYVRERLHGWLRRRRIVACTIADARLVRPARVATVERSIVGRLVERVERHGKWIRLTLDDGRLLFVHLAMTGWFELAESEQALRHERARITVSGRPHLTHVVYVDARRWGRWISSRSDTPTWAHLGPDPLNDTVDPAALRSRFRRSKSRSIKEALLDQTLLAGVGNIQATEALWKARVDPRARASALGDKQVDAILRAISWSIARTMADLARGERGKEDPFLVYGHRGQPCRRCKTALTHIILGGRTTTFCPGCQTK
jgi:formamidopyrimidine-DNA glycosylase